MKFSINKNTFVKSLEDVSKCIDPLNIYIDLRKFYIEVLDDLIVIKGSNGFFSIENKIEMSKINEINQKGKCLVSANHFLNIIKKCSGIIEIKVENNVMHIKNEKDNFEINLSNADSFPSIDFSLYGNKLKVNAAKLRKAIDNVLFATSQTNEDIILTGVNIKYEDGKLYVRASDSFRLAQDVIEVNDDRNLSFDITVANKNIKNLIPHNSDSDVTMYVNEQKINIIHDNTNFQSKIIEAPYKEVSQLFKVNFRKHLIIDKTVFNNAINKATVFSNSDGSYNKIYVTISKKEINLSTNADEIGRTKVVVSENDFSYEGDGDISIVLNYKFLKEAINVFNDKIKVNLIDSSGLVLIESETNSVKQIISPMMS